MKLPFFKRSKGKQLTSEELEIKRFITKTFGYRPQNVAFFVEALTHKSFQGNGSIASTPNERLEFLGDSILDAIVAEYLFLRYPEHEEGLLTQIKSKIVNRKTLSEIGDVMKIREYLRYNKGRTINIQGLEGNCLEALIGAIYLDGGYEKTKVCVINRIFRNYLDINRLLEEEIDFKSKLFIWCQKKHLSLEFEVTKENCQNGVWEYEIKVNVNKVSYGKGKGSSKKQAEQLASKETLMLVGEI